MNRPNADTHELDPSREVKATEILKHCMEQRDSYPLPDGYEIYIDLPTSMAFRMSDWCNMSKKGLADYLNVKQSQVSRWIRENHLPTRTDGRIDLWRYWDWQDEYEFWQKRGREQGWVDYPPFVPSFMRNATEQNKP